MASPDPKRSTRPAAELTTADIYGARHGIPEDVQAALQNVGRRNRQMVSMGRPLVPTQSLPAFTSPHFMNAQDTYRSAQALISKEALRAREIQPYGSLSPVVGGASASETVSALDLAPAQQERRLAFGPDGQIRVERARGTKRGEQGEQEDDDEDLDTIKPDVARLPRPVQQVDTADFPPVFTAPTSQPELFADPAAAAAAAMPPPPLPSFRATRGLPRRGFSKTVSAPVGRLGTWSGMDIDHSTGFAGFSDSGAGSNLGGGAPGAAAVAPAPAGPVAAPFTAGFGGFSPSPSFAAPKEEDEQDGFDVSEWAASEQF